jgi:hypothetical protein
MNEPRQHHLLPRSYLRRFADTTGRVTVVRRDLKASFTTSIERAARERDFYTVETEHGPSTGVEGMLGRIEEPAAGATTRILDGHFPPSQDDRVAIALFIALQFTRGRDHRHAYEMMADALFKASMEEVTEAGVRDQLRAALGRDPTEDEVASAFELVTDPGSYRIAPHQNESIGAMLEHLEVLAPYLLARTWQLVRFRRPVLLTSDCPVVLWTRPERTTALRGVGLATADNVRFPLDPRHALVLVKDTTVRDAIRDVNDEHSGELNLGTAARAYEWIYHHPEQKPLDGLAEFLPAPRPAVYMSARPLWHPDAQTRVEPREGE